MSHTPDPTSDIPAFLPERFADHTPDTLREIAAYAENRDPTLDVPDYVVRVIALQDEATREAIAAYAEAYATYLETHGERDEPDETEDDDSGEHDGPVIGRWNALNME